MEKYLWIIHNYNILPAALCAGAVMMLYLTIRVIYLKASRTPRKPVPVEISRVLLAGYITALVNIVWISIPEFVRMLFTDVGQLTGLLENGHYVKGCDILSCLFGDGITFSGLKKFEMLANVALFVPFGLLLPMAFRRLKWWQTDLICLGTTCTIELIQPLLGRAGDLDDIITNALGGIIGCALAKLALKIFKRKRESPYEKE